MPRSTKAIDALEIDIKASANNSSQELNTLITNIEKLANTLNTVDMKTITTDMTNFGKSLKGINTKGLSASMAGLANATIKYRNAIANVNVQNKSANSSFSAFKQGVDNIYSGLNRVNSKINDFAAKIRGANKETKNFAQSVGLLYARFFLLIRGIKGLTNQVKSSMDYIEVLNYFDSSFGQVAERGVAKWEEMGYESADAYYKSFSERAKKVTADMSGFYPEADGSLTALSSVSLGMNPQELLQYQAQFAQMSSSMGTTSEQALRLSEVLTKLGADFASVKNMDFGQVWGDMASGLVGMSRTLDKYGVNIRNANMEMKLHELGINATVASLSQADKALLRTIILLDSSKYAWSDLSETLNTPANQFRMLSNNIKLLGQMIGNILLPIVAKVLPYINAFVIALQRLFTWLAKILGIDLSSLQANNATPDNSALSDMLDDAEGLADALDDDATNAKKLKKQLQGFDALNNLTSKEDSNSGKLGAGLASGLLNDAFLKASEEYLKAWQDAFAKLENDAQKIADKIQAFFMKIWKPIGNAWKVWGSYVITGWKVAFRELGRMLESIGEDFMEVWQQRETKRIFSKIFKTIGTWGFTVGELADRFREAWENNDTGQKILENIRDITLVIAECWADISTDVFKWARDLDLTTLLTNIEELTRSFKPIIETFMAIKRDFINQVLLPLAKWTLEEGLPNLLKVLKDLAEKVKWEKIRAKLSELWDHVEPFAERVGQGLIDFLDKIADKLENWVNNGGFEKFVDLVIKFIDSFSASDITKICDAIVKGFIGIKLALPVVGALKGLTTLVFNLKLLGAIKGLGGTAKGVGALASATSGLSQSFVGLGGAGFLKTIGAMSTMDLSTVFGAGTMAEIGATAGLGLAESFLAAFVGFKLGKKLGEVLKPEDISWYRNFHWTGQGGFFDSVRYLCEEMFPQWIDKIPEGIRNAIPLVTSVSGLLEKAVTSNFERGILSTKEGYANLKEWLDENLTWTNLLGALTGGGGVLVPLEQTMSDMFVAIEEKVSAFFSIGSLIPELIKEGIDYGKEKDAKPASRNLAVQLVEVFTGAIGSFDASNGKGKFFSIGANIADALANGINSSSGKSKENLTRLGTDMLKPFSDLSPSFAKMGGNLMIGFSNGLTPAMNAIMSKVNTFATNVLARMRTVWQIHSPSKAMDDMGYYFMKGFQNGIEGMYQPINESLSRFGTDLVSAPKIEDAMSQFDGNTASFNSSATQNFTNDNSETNALLRQQNSLLQAILEKDMGITEGALFKSVQNSASSYYKMTGNKAFA